MGMHNTLVKEYNDRTYITCKLAEKSERFFIPFFANEYKKTFDTD